MKVLIHDAESKRWRKFDRPVKIFCAGRHGEVIATLNRAADFAREKNLPLAGWLSYEAACGVDPALPCGETDFPMVYFAAFETCDFAELPAVKSPPKMPRWRSEMSREEYSRNFERIKQYIADGETYQVNYTFRMRCDSFDSADAWDCWRAMMAAQRCEYGAFIETDNWTICSASPELFFSSVSGEVKCRPMKGTAARGLWPAADEQAARELKRCEKNRAENLMIVDMMRNDLGRIALSGSVEAERLCVVEKYPTLWQMVSEIGCRCECGWVEVLKALFPCASITGAPKRRTMQIIRELETSPRKIYTGSIGFVLPGGRSQFNVAIRTMLVDAKNASAEYGVGGGVVWDSRDTGEYDESLLKARVLMKPAPRPELLETLLWENDEYFLFARHIDRLLASAKYFDYAFNLPAVLAGLGDCKKNFSASARYRVRLVMHENGDVFIEHFEMPAQADDAVMRVALANGPVDKHDVLLYHKTTSREIYELAKAERSDVDDVILFNSHGLLTESTIANIVLKIDGKLLTPDISAGLLGGVFREELIELGEIEAADLPVELLDKCEELWLINSVRKWRKAALVK